MTQLAACGCPADDLLYTAASAALLDINDEHVRFVHQLIQEYFAAIAWQEKLADDDLRRYWPDGWLIPSVWEETAILLAKIMEDMTPLVEKLLASNPPLAARCIAESGGVEPERVTTDKVQSTLVQIATDPLSSVLHRNVAGMALNHLGDPRPGVGVQNGLPAIDWVKISEIDPQTGQHEFIYQEDEQRSESSFWIARYPVTYRQFQIFVDSDGGFSNSVWWNGLTISENHHAEPEEQCFKYWNHPRENVSWYDAIAFCRWLTTTIKIYADLLPPEMYGRDDWRITLPTEWQWEKAAHGYDGRAYPWGDEYDPSYANVHETYSLEKVDFHYLQKTSAVGTYPQGVSPFGVLDMSGNVWEWCLNEYRKPGRVQVGGNATRVLRGGSWNYTSHLSSGRLRNWEFPLVRGSDLGFRVVLVASVPIHSGSAL